MGRGLFLRGGDVSCGEGTFPEGRGTFPEKTYPKGRELFLRGGDFS